MSANLLNRVSELERQVREMRKTIEQMQAQLARREILKLAK